MDRHHRQDAPRDELVLVTGATGYVGGRLVPELLRAGWRVRVLVRHAERLAEREWGDKVEVVAGDVTDPTTLDRALAGVRVAYYLIHSMGATARFGDLDRRAAQRFAEAATTARVGRIVYLGGLHPDDDDLSPHLRSRVEVGEILLSCPVPTIVLNAAVIIGSGSASFEMLRHLTERLPVMITPQWVNTRIQPIAIRDVLHYLVGSATAEPGVNRAFDIGGPEVVTYRDMVQRYAKVAGLQPRRILPLPVLTPWLASHWVGLVTPVPASIARPLVLSLLYEVVVTERAIDELVGPPAEGCLDLTQAIERALDRTRGLDVSTTWTSASYHRAPSDPLPEDPDRDGGDILVDERVISVNAPPQYLWAEIEGLGGATGWHSWHLAWSVRGGLDRLAGGPGLRRGRRHPTRLITGDAVDWWRVERIVPGQLLRLRSEMRMPGVAWLELKCETDADGRAVFRQRALYRPFGPVGRLYWWTMLPFHGIVFSGMQHNIAHAARLRAQQRQDREPGEESTPT